MKTHLVSAAFVISGFVTSQAALALPSSSQRPYQLKPAIGQYSKVQLDPGLAKTGGAGTFLIVDPEDDLFIVVLTNHGLPDYADFFVAYDDMLEEIGPHRIADSVAMAMTDTAL